MPVVGGLQTSTTTTPVPGRSLRPERRSAVWLVGTGGTLAHDRGHYPVNPMLEPSSAPTSDGLGLVEVSVPLRTGFIATLRTVAASLGADAGFSIDEIDDLRLAISEIVSSLVDSSTPDADRIVASFDLLPTGIAITITTHRGETDVELDDLATSILQSVVDEYEVAGTRVRLLKLASEASGSDVERSAREA